MKGQPILNPDMFKPNTVRKGVNGYWWSVVEAADMRYQDPVRFKALDPRVEHVWFPLGDHSTKNGKPVLKRMKLEMNEEQRNALENNGIITVSFNLMPTCEKSGKLPKRCDLEHEATHLSVPLRKTAWTFGLFNYASAPTDTYKYIHTYEGSLDSMKTAVAILNKHYEKHKQEGSISQFHITTETYKESMARMWDF
jgi:hypothetical protein